MMGIDETRDEYFIAMSGSKEEIEKIMQEQFSYVLDPTEFLLNEKDYTHMWVNIEDKYYDFVDMGFFTSDAEEITIVDLFILIHKR